MKKIKITKKLKKGKTKSIVNKSGNVKPAANPQNAYAEKYLQFYDDIKTPSRKNDW